MSFHFYPLPKSDIDTLLTVDRIMRWSNPQKVKEALERALADEQRARDQFCSITHDDVKAKFINGKEYVHQLPVMRRHSRA